MRSIATGYLAFGNANIPVRLYSATENGTVSFKQRHAVDNGEVRYQKVCATCGKSLTDDEIVKEMNGVTFTKAELDALKDKESGETIRLYGFCDRAEVDDLILEKAYFIGTADKKKGGFELFAIVQKAMVRAGKVAIIGWISRGKKHLAMMMPYGNGFLAKEILYSSECRSFEDVEMTVAEVGDEVVAKAVNRIQKMKLAFDHDAYRDDYAETVRKIVEAKALGDFGTVVSPSPVVKKSSVDELFADD